jgi:phosphate transport system protein
MRAEYEAELDDVRHILISMANEVRDLMRRATHSLLTADADEAVRVVTGDEVVNADHHRIEDRIYGLLARQAPVAGDLRLLFCALHIAADLERMGDLAKHVAKTGLRRHPFPAVPDELASAIADMAAVADRISAKISGILSNPSATDAAELDSDDDAMDELQRGLFVVLLSADWRQGVEPAIDGAMLGRFYERYADHAVNAGRQMYFLVTGEPLH